jgi:hypothetical protein
MYCDTTTSFGHLSNVEVTEKYFKEYYQKCLNEGVDMNNLYGK